jgi:NAD-dependent dihydropyrimidine dehydrogenase PreA subunit
MFKVVVDKDACISCGQCVDVCQMQVLEMVDDKAEPVHMDKCNGDRSCVETCPVSCITVDEV